MGKSQKKRAMRRHNPIRVPDSHIPPGLASAEASSSTKSDALLPIIQKLESPEPQDRIWACAAVCNLIQNDPATRRLLQGKNIVGALINRLSDAEEDVVTEAAGTLRNLCVDGGYEICGEMYNKNILSPLKSFIPKISATLTQLLTSPKDAPDGAHKLVYSFAENIITLFWCLSETSNKALQAINSANLIPFLMAFLSCRQQLPISTVNAADDNFPAIEAIRSDAEYVSCLFDIANPKQSASNGTTGVDDGVVGLQVLACGILRNIAPLPPMTQAASIDLDTTVILPVLLPLLQISLLDASNKVHTLASLPPEMPKQDPKSLKTDHKSAAEVELERIEGRLRTVQLALEILTGICARLPDPVPGVDVDENDADLEMEGDEEVDEEEDEAIIADDKISNESPNEEETPSTPLSLLSSLTPPLLTLSAPTPLSFPPVSFPSLHPPTTSVLSTIHLRALECLNNLFLCINEKELVGDAEIEGAKKVWADIWVSVLGKVGVEGVSALGQERRKEMWEVGVGVLWGLARVCRTHLIPDADQVKLLMGVCEAAEDDRTKVRCIGTLGCLAQYPESVEANKVISTWLLSLQPPPATPVDPYLHSLSLIIDIYSDENSPYDINFRTLQMLQALESKMDVVKKTVRGIDKRKEGGKELKEFGEELAVNLRAFIKYRKGLKL